MTKQDIRTSEYGKKRIGGLSKKDATMAYLNIPHRPKRGRGGDSYSHLTHFYRYGRADYSFWQFLGAFVKLKEATIDFVMSVCPSVCLFAWNNPAPTGRIIMKFCISVFFENLPIKLQFH